MRTSTLVATIIGVILGSLGTFFISNQSAEAPTAPASSNPEFSWSYESFEKDEIPQTTIKLTANYSDGTNETKTIDTIAGDCNDYGMIDEDVYEQSMMIVCYYAGLGHYFKVIESNGEYLVQRKVFEEASPDYDPPVQEFETVERF